MTSELSAINDDIVRLSSYNFQDLMKFFSARRASYHTDARMIDDVLYTPYRYDHFSSHTQPPKQLKVRWQPSDGSETAAGTSTTGDLLGIPGLSRDNQDDGAKKKKSKFDAHAEEAEIFLFSYGTVVIWGMTEPQEKRFLSSLCVPVSGYDSCSTSNPHAENDLNPEN